jgi:murein DD-endopeptidase MepM/ murein hydrolase activator NlpD
VETVGVLILITGAYVIYSGVTSINPVDVLRAIVKSPGNASAIIDGAVTAAKSIKPVSTKALPTLTDSSGNELFPTGTNPFSKYTVTSPYGEINHEGTDGVPHTHMGIDYAIPSGTPLPSIIGGTVKNATMGTAGQVVTVTGTGLFSGWSVQYQDVREYTQKDGALVLPGQIVAKSGGGPNDPGHGNSTGAHLHLQVAHSGQTVNPSQIFTWLSNNKANIDTKLNSPFGTPLDAVG